MPTDSPLTVRPIEPGDREAWERLYADYAVFYGKPQSAAMRATVWTWLHDPDHELSGLLAIGDGAPVGLAHYRPFARPLDASTGGYLDDLYVVPKARGSGVSAALLRHLAAIGHEAGWSVIRWITDERNYRARGLYDRHATRTGWVTYDMKPEP